MAIFVVDASVALAWCFEDETSSFTDGLLDRLRQGRRPHYREPAHEANYRGDRQGDTRENGGGILTLGFLDRPRRLALWAFRIICLSGAVRCYSSDLLPDAFILFHAVVTDLKCCWCAALF